MNQCAAQDDGLYREMRDTSPCQDINAQGTEAFAADFVAGKGMLLDERDGPPGASQQQCGKTAGRAGADDQGIEH
jgi:hypothetical protein